MGRGGVHLRALHKDAQPDHTQLAAEPREDNVPELLGRAQLVVARLVDHLARLRVGVGVGARARVRVRVGLGVGVGVRVGVRVRVRVGVRARVRARVRVRVRVRVLDHLRGELEQHRARPHVATHLQVDLDGGVGVVGVGVLPV